MAPHDEHPESGPNREPRAPIEFGRLLRAGDDQRLGAMPADRDRQVLLEIREDFGLEPEPDRTVRPSRPGIERTVPWSRRLRLVLQPMAAVAGLALVFLLTRDVLLPTPPTASPAGDRTGRSATAPPPAAPPIRGSNTMAARVPQGPTSPAADMPASAEAAPGLAPTNERLALAAAARRIGQAESLAVLLTSLVVAGDELPGGASPDLPAAIAAIAAGFGDAEIELPEALPAKVSLKAPANPAAAFAVWEVELALENDIAGAIEAPADGSVELVGWRVAIDLGGLDVVAVGDGRLAGFTSPPTYDPAALSRGTLVLAAVSDRGKAIDGPVVVARLQARGLAADAVSPMPLAVGSFAAVERGAAR